MAKLANRVRDETTGVGIADLSVTIRRKNGGAAVDTATTDSDGRFEWSQNGSPGDVEWTATSAGKTRVVSGDSGIQTDVWFTQELVTLMETFTPGVLFNVGNELAVTAPGGRNVQVDTGAGIATGIPFFQHDAATFAISANGSGNGRIDRVCFQVVRTGTDRGEAAIVILEGTPAATPVAPVLTQDADTYQVSLAQVAVASGAASIVTGNITDEREAALPGGLGTVAIQDADDIDITGGNIVGVGLDDITFLSVDGVANLNSDVNFTGPLWTNQTFTFDGSDITGVGDFDADTADLGVTSVTDFTANTAEIGVEDYDQTTIRRLIVKAASQPSVAVGAAAGSGATAQINWGNDTNFEIEIATGGSGVSTGELCTVTFDNAFPSADYSPITQKVSQDASGLDLYFNRASNTLGIFTNVAPGTSDTLRFTVFIVANVAA
jgi:hypothetical protein